MSLRPLRRTSPSPLSTRLGARPNFVKMAPLIEALDRRGVADQVVVHTGQHYDRRMSEEILKDLALPVPDTRWEAVRLTWRTNRQGSDRVRGNLSRPSRR